MVTLDQNPESEGPGRGDNRRAQARRDQILSAAGKVFAQAGYSRTTMEQVAHEAGLSKGSLYNYFPGKQELFMELFRRSLAAAEQQTDVLIASEVSAAEKIHRLVDVWFEEFEFFCDIGGLVLEFWAGAAREQRAGEMTEAVREVYQGNRRRVAAIVSQGMASGEFSAGDPMNSATTIMALLDGLMLQAILHVGVQVDAAFLEALKRRLVAALASGPHLRNNNVNHPAEQDD